VVTPGSPGTAGPVSQLRPALLTERVRRAQHEGRRVVIKSVTDTELHHHLAAAGQRLGDTIAIAAPIARLHDHDGRHRLIYPDHGTYTAETLAPSEVIRLSRRVCELLRANDLIWLDCAPKNMVLPDGNPDRVVLVDFDHGLVPASSKPDASILVRCIQMAEEYAPLRVDLFPFWPQAWSLPAGLRARRGAAELTNIPVTVAGSRRVTAAADMLGLDDEIADHELLRLYRVFADLVAGTRDLASHSAWDHVSRSDAGTRVRVTASLLAHWARRHGSGAVAAELTSVAGACAVDVALDDDPLERSHQLAVERLGPFVHAQARSLVGEHWPTTLRSHARASVLTPAVVDTYRPLVLA
jgi:hypothetical protein